MGGLLEINFNQQILFIFGRSFYFPEIANGCTSIAFQNSSAKNSDGITVYEIAIKTINQWTQSPGVLIGTMETETQNSSIMNIQVRKSNVIDTSTNVSMCKQLNINI